MNSKRLAATCLTTIIFLLCHAGNVLAQSHTVRQRFKALQKNWSSGRGDPDTYIIAFALLCLVLLLAYYFYLSRKNKALEKQRAIEKSRDYFEEAELSSKECRLLSIILSGPENVQPQQLLSSPAVFDETVGRYLRRFCTQQVQAGPVLTALIVIRKKLLSTMWSDHAFGDQWKSRFAHIIASRTEEGEDRQSSGTAAPGVLGLECIPFLSWVKVTNLSREVGPVRCRVIEKPGQRLRLQIRIGLSRLEWTADDSIRIQAALEHQGHPEFLGRIVRVDAPESGLCLVEYASINALPADASLRSQSQESPYLPFDSFLCRKEEEPSGITVDAIDMQGGYLRSKKPVSAGDRVTVNLALDEGEEGVEVPATILYSCRSTKGEYNVEARFEALSEDAARFIADLYMQKEVPDPLMIPDAPMIAEEEEVEEEEDDILTTPP